MPLALSHSSPYLPIPAPLGGEYFHPVFTDGEIEAQSSYEVAEPVSEAQIHILGRQTGAKTGSTCFTVSYKMPSNCSTHPYFFFF